MAFVTTRRVCTAAGLALLAACCGISVAFAQENASDRAGANYAPAEEPAAAATPATKPAKPKTKPVAAKPLVSNPAEKHEPAKAETKVEAKPAAAKSEPAKSTAEKAQPEKAKPEKTATSEDRNDPLTGVPLGERAAIRAALLWGASPDTPPAGEDALTAAIKAYRKRNGIRTAGALSAPEREQLLEAAKSHDAEFGWTVVVDPVTGIRLGLPGKMVPLAREGKFGTHWTSRHGDVQVETFRIKTGENLSALFDAQKKDPATRRVEYSVMRADNFIVSGLQGLKKFAVRAQLREGELRGFTMLYDQALEGIVAPVMVAMASAFAPFPARTAPYATLSRSVEYGTGLVVSANGAIVTDRKLAEGCQVIVAAGIGDAERVAEDKEHGLALLRVYGKRNLPAARLTPAEQGKSADLTLAGIGDPRTEEGASNALTEIKARLIDGGAIELRRPIPMAGFSGAAALDAQGRVIGLVETSNAVVASAQAAAPPVRLVPAAAIRDFLARNHVNAPADAANPKAAVVRVICVRK